MRWGIFPQFISSWWISVLYECSCCQRCRQQSRIGMASLLSLFSSPLLFPPSLPSFPLSPFPLFFLLFLLPLPLSPSFSLHFLVPLPSLEVGLLTQLGDLGETWGKLPQPKSFWCILPLNSDIWWQQFLVIFLRINCPDFIGLVWRSHTKFQIGMVAALPYRFRRHCVLYNKMLSCRVCYRFPQK